MAYATQTQMIERFGERELIELTDRAEPPSGEIDAAVLVRALDDASAFIDGYLGKVAALPLAAPPPILSKLCADVARLYLHGEAAAKDAPVRLAHDAAVRWLTDAARGLVSLGDGTTGDMAQEAPDVIQFDGPGRVFTRESMKGY
jgi:phage gp36-like protein